MRIELLWFDGSPRREEAERLVRDRLAELNLSTSIRRPKVADQSPGKHHCSPGLPTIRVNGSNVEPRRARCNDCTPPVPRLHHQTRVHGRASR